MERVETIDLTGVLALSQKFAGIEKTCGSVSVQKKCSGAEFDDDIEDQMADLEELEDKLYAL